MEGVHATAARARHTCLLGEVQPDSRQATSGSAARGCGVRGGETTVPTNDERKTPSRGAVLTSEIPSATVRIGERVRLGRAATNSHPHQTAPEPSAPKDPARPSLYGTRRMLQ